MRPTSRMFAIVTILVGAVATLAATDIQLPPETSSMKDSPLAGYAIASQKCGICHSADYVDYQPPGLSKTQWTGEMTKMQHLYGAPISDDDVRLLGIYLAATFGDAGTVTAEDRALQAAPAVAAVAAVAVAGATDVQTLLTDNGCLACHALDHRIVGPGYHDVALKYQADPQAAMKVAASIRAGGGGRWGPVPMPPFESLSAEDATTLAKYVLAQ